jgi:hypothetical protein
MLKIISLLKYLDKRYPSSFIYQLVRMTFIAFSPEKLRIRADLKLNPLKLFKHPIDVATPRVFFSSRAKFEDIVKGQGYNSEPHINQFLDNLITITLGTTNLNLRVLDGVVASKSAATPRFYKLRSGAKNMAEFGGLIEDLSGLEGLSGQDLIHKCLNWPQIRFNQGVNLISDSWHKRTYWDNSGGSHHMGKACYELENQNIDFFVKCSSRHYSFNRKSVDQAESKLGIYVIHHTTQRLFESNDYFSLSQLLGITLVRLGDSDGMLGFYEFVFIDRAAKHSDLSIEVMEMLCGEGRAMGIREFIEKAEA